MTTPRAMSVGGRLRPWWPDPHRDEQREEWLFSARARRRGLRWFAFAVVLSSLWGLRVRDPATFMGIWVLTCGFFTTPALVLTFKAWRRALPEWRRLWRYALGAVAGLYATGVAIMQAVGTDRPAWRGVALATLALSMVAFALANVEPMAQRSGERSFAVDVLEAIIAVVAVAAPLLLLIGERVLQSPELWIGLMLIGYLITAISGFWMSVVVFVRSTVGRRLAEGIGMALAAMIILNALVLAEHLSTHYSLPNPLVMGINAVSMGLVMLLPLMSTKSKIVEGDRRAPAQIRTGRVVAALTVGAIGVLVVVVAVDGFRPATVLLAASAAAVLVVLGTVRHLVTIAETRRLYAELERSAEARRALLAEVLQSLDADRRRVAAQLHQQASASYAAFASLAHAGESGPARVPGVATEASDRMSARFAAQAESLRELTAAISPLAAESAHGGVAAVIRAYVDSLYGDRVSPVLTIDVADELRLDWLTETVALRVAQEAIRNVWAHAAATSVTVELGEHEGVPFVRITDDGLGFAPDQRMTESGIAVMRTFVAFCDGELSVDSGTDGGITVEARLGRPWARTLRPRLRLVD